MLRINIMNNDQAGTRQLNGTVEVLQSNNSLTADKVANLVMKGNDDLKEKLQEKIDDNKNEINDIKCNIREINTKLKDKEKIVGLQIINAVCYALLFIATIVLSAFIEKYFLK